MYLFEIIHLLNVECRGLADMIEELQVELSAVDKLYRIVIHGKFFSIIEVNFAEVKKKLDSLLVINPFFSIATILNTKWIITAAHCVNGYVAR